MGQMKMVLKLTKNRDVNEVNRSIFLLSDNKTHTSESLPPEVGYG